jgi:hypothetical protein
MKHQDTSEKTVVAALTLIALIAIPGIICCFVGALTFSIFDTLRNHP